MISAVLESAAVSGLPVGVVVVPVRGLKSLVSGCPLYHHRELQVVLIDPLRQRCPISGPG